LGGIFQRPICDLGNAFEFAFRPLIGSTDPDTGGACDDAPLRVALFSAGADPGEPGSEWREFSLCPEHRSQLTRYDSRLVARGIASRFRSIGPNRFLK
jgi:hypothetical protein